MLALAGIRLHPALRATLGLVVVTLGLAFHLGPPVIFVGAALLLWGLGGLLGLGPRSGRADDDEAGPRS